MSDLTRLIPRIDEPASPLTRRQETDATTALSRGIAEYMRSLSIDWGGAVLAFKRATDTWADYEDSQGNESVGYPRAFCGTAGADGSYDGGLGEDSEHGVVLGGTLSAGGGVVLDLLDELTITNVVEVHCDNPEQRRGVVAMLERAFRPYRGKSGFLLELPHYFNVRSTHTAMRVTMLDNEEDAARNYRLARIVLQSRVSVVVPHEVRPIRALHNSSTVSESSLPTTPAPTVRRGQQ